MEREHTIEAAGGARVPTLDCRAGREPAIVDILVVGGGIHGAAVARDAALRGLSVTLLEAGDFAWATSSRSSKLVHGGIRYLETARFGLVREALRERSILLETAAAFVRPLRFMIPHYWGEGRPAPWISLGLRLYAAFAGRHPLAGHERVGPGETLDLEPGLRSDGLGGAFLYWDAQMDDALLCVSTAVGAVRAGADVRNHTRVTSLRREGRAWRAGYRDAIDGTEGEAEARFVVNAAGPWADEVRAIGLGASAPSMRRTRGTHVVLPALTRAHALLLTARRDGRVFFVLPWGRHSLIGTTDVDDAVPPCEVAPPAEDIRYLLEEGARVLPAARDGRRPVRAFAGLRALVRGTSGRPWANTREHRLVVEDGMATIVGGKFTTHRSLAERVVDLAARALGRPAGACRTATTPVGAERADSIGALRARHPQWLDLGDGQLISEAEVVHAVTVERARRLEDVLLRRTRLWLDSRALRRAAEPAAGWMTPLLSWSDERRRAEVEALARTLDGEDSRIEEGMR
jgi:glycerol-3-phosphate dehydrogenase